jgi:hypothetical protein
MPHRKHAAALIARLWRGRTARETADEYQTYLIATGVRSLQSTALDVELFREDRETDTEFMVI